MWSGRGTGPPATSYATELVRLSLDLYADGDGDEHRFVPFSSPVAYHAGPIAVHRIQGGVNPDGLYDIDTTVQVYPFPDLPERNVFGEPLGYTGSAGALGTTDNCYAMGCWSLAPGESLVVETTPVACAYWSLQLWNRW